MKSTNIYKVFYNGKSAEVEAISSYEAQKKYATANKIADNKRYQITVMLLHKACEKEVVHSPMF